uniref:protein DCL homolog, chloroplastic-like n=1 Tax=Erigeron canadensis TaxID=72917 RepID=UPI001CB8FCE4|nr:protein DCL homolog, chloroplastic-like [Erigeron canadensis]
MATAAAPLLSKSIIPHLRLHLCLHLHFNTTLPAAVCSLVRRPFYSATASESPRPIRKPPPPPPITYDDDKLSLLTNNNNKRRYTTKDSKWENDPDFRKWKDKEAEILLDIDPITFLIKDILHSDRYMDGERLTPGDEKTVVEKILAYHPHSEDKIGCGLDSVMVDRHPQFRNSRCLFVVRTDGVWIDFSYQKCIRAYIRQKYPSYAERFIKEHYKRSSS